MSCLVKHHLLGLDVNDFGVRVEGITGADDVRLISGSGNLDNRLGRCFFSVFGDYCAEQPIGGWWKGVRPAEWTKQIVVYDRAVEIGLWGLKGRRLEAGARRGAGLLAETRVCIRGPLDGSGFRYRWRGRGEIYHKDDRQ